MILRGRRVVYAAVPQAAAVLAEHQLLLQQLDDARQELALAQHRLAQLRVAVLARQEANEQVYLLHRERQILRAQSAERDPARPVN